ncbi:MAG TPA: serine hydrolase domain-containing protein, partial [Pyrinomonadaceae bacterium]|nr:serine hydrolase domain-containing protein [Pyrinomonadaceae bacterium]
MSTGETKPESRISALLSDRIKAGDFPSAVYVVAERGRAVFADALGDAAREPEKRPATLDTIYDLASLTKPLVTGLLCARLAERGALNIDDRVAEHLP